MPLSNKRLYQKQEPFRSASLFVIICEGEKREPQYFEYFDGISSRIRIKVIPSLDGKSSPKHLLDNAHSELERIQFIEEDELWFVLDIDKWTTQIHSLHVECREKSNWNIAISNPCFEVWLYYHFNDNAPQIELSNCGNWKQALPSIHPGGFDSQRHPSLISYAILRAKKNYTENGYLPSAGCTQVFRLAEKMMPLIQKYLT